MTEAIFPNSFIAPQSKPPKLNAQNISISTLPQTRSKKPNNTPAAVPIPAPPRYPPINIIQEDKIAIIGICTNGIFISAEPATAPPKSKARLIISSLVIICLFNPLCKSKIPFSAI